MPITYLISRKKKKKSIGQNAINQPVIRQHQPTQTNLTGKTGTASALKSAAKSSASRYTQSTPQETATQRAERERSQKLRNGISLIVRSQAKRNFDNKTYVNKSSLRPIASAIKHNPLLPTSARKVTGGHGIGEQRTFSKLRSFRQPASEVAEYTRKQQNKYVYTPNNDYRFDAKGNMLMKKDPISIEYGKKLRAGMPSTNTAIMSWRSDPTQKEREYRDKYGYTKKMEEALDRRLNDDMMEAYYSPTTGEIKASKNGRAFLAGHTDAWAREDVEDTVNRQFGIKPDDDTLAKIEAQRNSFNYGAGTALGQMEQYALTRGLLGTAGLVGNGTRTAKGVKSAFKAMGVEAGIDQLASVPMNIVDALKADSTGDTVNRFVRNQSLDLVFSGVMEFIPFFKNESVRDGLQKAFNLHSAAKKEANVAVKEALEKKATDTLGDIQDGLQKEVNDVVATVGAQRPIVNKTADADEIARRYTNMQEYGQIDEPVEDLTLQMRRGLNDYGERPSTDIGAGERFAAMQEPVERNANPRYNELRGDANGAEKYQNTVERARSGEGDIRANVGETPEQSRPKENPTGVGRESNIGEHERTTGNGNHVVLNETQRNTLDAAGVTNAHMGGADRATFSNALSEGRAANKYGSYVDPQSVENLEKNEAKAFLSDDGMAGIAVEKDGNIVGAFKHPNSKYGNSVKDMLLTARANGGTKMDCYGEKLVRLYEDVGYVPVARVDFNASFVDDPLLLKNEPSIYVMMRNADDIDTAVRKTANGEYSHLSKEELDALPTMEYGDALAYRDDLLKNGGTPKSEELKAEAKPKEEPKVETPKTEPKAEETEHKVEPQAKAEKPNAEEPKAKPKAPDSASNEEPPKKRNQVKGVLNNEEPKAKAEQKPKEEPKESPKDGLGRDVFNGQERYHPSGAGKTERGWKAVERRYEKHSIEWLRREKQVTIPKKIAKGMSEKEAMERAKLIDSLMDEKERYRYGTLKNYNGEDVTASFDTLSHSEKTELIHDEMKRAFIEEGTGRKVGMNPKEAVEAAVSRVEKNADAVRERLTNAAAEAKEGKFPKEYNNSQEYYAEILAYLEHSTSKMEDLIEKGLKGSEEYKIMERDTANIVSGAMAVRSQEGYGAVQYNLLCRSSGDVRVAIIQKAVDDINEQYEKQLEKAARKAGKELTEAEKIKVSLTEDAIEKIKKVNPDSPLEMNQLMSDISREIWNQVPANGREVFNSIRKSSMLLNPKTHERNFIGNFFMIPARILKDTIGAPIEKRAIAKGKMDITDASKARVKRFSQEYKELKKGAVQIWAEWKDFVIGNAKYYDNAAPSASKLLGKRPVGGAGTKLLTAGIDNPKKWRIVGDAIMNANGWALEKMDELFLKFHFVDSVIQSCKARGLDPSDLTSEQIQSVVKTATGEAQRATFRDVSDAAKIINDLKAVNPNDGKFKKGVSWVIDTNLPFVNVPINVARRAWDYSPFGLMQGITSINKAMKAGDSNGVRKAIDKLSSGTVGTGVFVVGVLLGRNGGLTASLSDGKEGYYEQDQGYQEYSVNLEGEDGINIPFIKLKNEDGVSVSLSPFAPWSIPLYMGVEAGHFFDGDRINFSALFDAAGSALAPMFDMSVMQGPLNTINSIRESNGIDEVVFNLMLTTATNHYMQYVPTIAGQWARAVDPVRRDTTSYQEDSVMKNLEKNKLKLQSKIPSTPLTDNKLYNISSTGIQPYVDGWGREQRTSDNAVKRFAYEFFSPTYARKKNITAVDKEIGRLNDLAASEDEKIVPTKLFANKISFDGGKVDISRKDLTVYNKAKGTAAYVAASKLIETDKYLSASVEEQRKMLNQVFSEAGSEAKRQTLLSKGLDEYKVYTDGFTGGKAEEVENARAAGIKAKDYYTTLTDKAADTDGNGYYSKSEFYDYLLGQKQYNNEQRAILMAAKDKSWAGDKNPFITGEPPKDSKEATASNANYTDAIKNTGLSEEQFNKVMSSDKSKIDANGSGRVSQDEYQAYLDSFDFLTNEQKSAIWKQYNTHWKRNPYDGTTASSSGGRRRSRSGRRSGGSGKSSSSTYVKSKVKAAKYSVPNANTSIAELKDAYNKAKSYGNGTINVSNIAKENRKLPSSQKLSSSDLASIFKTTSGTIKAPSFKAISSSGLSKTQKKALIKLMQKKLKV